MEKEILKFFLLVFIVGFVSDVIIHYFSEKNNWSLMPYYRSLGTYKYLFGAILGGLACLFSVIVAYLLYKNGLMSIMP
jgi:uncharacterized membrane protein